MRWNGVGMVLEWLEICWNGLWVLDFCWNFVGMTGWVLEFCLNFVGILLNRPQHTPTNSNNSLINSHNIPTLFQQSPSIRCLVGTCRTCIHASGDAAQTFKIIIRSDLTSAAMPLKSSMYGWKQSYMIAAMPLKPRRQVLGTSSC